MKKLSTALSAISAISIVWYFITSYSEITNWWCLPLIAAVTAIVSILLPVLLEKVKPFWSITATGLVLLILQVLSNFMMISSFWGLLLTILTIALIAELLAHRDLSIGDIIFDIFISAIAALLIVKLEGAILTLITLIVAFSLMLIIDFKFNFSLKRNNIGVKHNKKETVNEQTSEE